MNVIDTFRLDGRVALLTGGAGLYGRQILAALAEAGAKVYIASRNLESLEKVAKECREMGQDVHALQLDQADESSVLQVRDAILKDSGRIDILINNAVARPMKSFDAPLADFAESVQVNVVGVFALTRAIGDVMAEQGSGSIINVGSIFGMVGPDPWVYEGTDIMWSIPDYFFNKGGMINFTRFIASHYGAKGVRCNCISPGGFETTKHMERFVKQYNRTTCLGRMANDTDVKGIIVLLASDASVYITGTNIPVDGGRTAI